MKICFLDLSCRLETVNDLETNPRGGMVSSLFEVSDYLSLQGHDVYVVIDIKKPSTTTRSGTRWVNKRIDEEFDFLVCNRGAGDGYPEVNAKHRILWTHDLPHAGFIQNPKTIKAFTAVFMSDYAERIWRDFYKDIEKSFTIPNGVDKSIFYPREKDLGYIIFSSAPNRGLKRLPFIFDCIEIRMKKPIRMSAYSNLKKLHPGEVDPEIRDEEEDGFSIIYNRVAESKVSLLDPIPQKQLAEEFGCASLMILPTDYPEICSNTILQALSSGIPIVTTGRLGSAEEWIKNGWNGFVTKWLPVDYMVYQVELIRHIVKILEDEKLHRRMIENAAKTKIYSWEEIGQRWDRMLHKLY